jgi:hypothetical protein
MRTPTHRPPPIHSHTRTLRPQHTKTFTVGGDDVSRVTDMALSPNDEDLAVVCASGQAYGFKLASYELYKVRRGTGGGLS